MSGFINFNGNILEAGTPVIPADNRSLRYGDGLFETMKMRQGCMVAADDHFSRLLNGLKMLGFDLPYTFTPALLTMQMEQLARKNQVTARARIRLNVFRREGGLYHLKNHTPHYIIETGSLPADNDEWKEQGLITGIYDAARKSCDAFSHLKSNNYLPYVMAALHAEHLQWDDAILLNAYGRVCESSVANIFLVKDEILFTPPLEEGCVAGTMRKRLLTVLPGAGYKVVEKSITVEEMLEADELFLTNAIAGIRWIRQVAHKTYTAVLSRRVFTTLFPANGSLVKEQTD